MTQGDLLRVARKYRDLGVHEDPSHSNRGPHIDDWLRLVGADLGMPWCAAFVCGCVYEANGNKWPTGFRKSASALGILRNNSGLVVPGRDLWPEDIVIFDHGGGTGHVVIVESAAATRGVHFFYDISGNSNDTGAREGDRVCSNVRSADDVRFAGVIRLQMTGAIA